MKISESQVKFRQYSPTAVSGPEIEGRRVSVHEGFKEKLHFHLEGNTHISKQLTRKMVETKQEAQHSPIAKNSSRNSLIQVKLPTFID